MWSRSSIPITPVNCKLYNKDKSKSYEVFNGAWDIANVDSSAKALLAMGEGVEAPAGVQTHAEVRSVFMDTYAALAKHHMKNFGTTILSR